MFALSRILQERELSWHLCLSFERRSMPSRERHEVALRHICFCQGFLRVCESHVFARQVRRLLLRCFILVVFFNAENTFVVDKVSNQGRTLLVIRVEPCPLFNARRQRQLLADLLGLEVHFLTHH